MPPGGGGGCYAKFLMLDQVCECSLTKPSAYIPLKRRGRLYGERQPFKRPNNYGPLAP